MAMQLVSLPLFLAHWDATTYGRWLILTALPAYLYMADGGIVAAAGNQMTMALGRGDRTEAQSALASAAVFLLVVCAAMLSIALPTALWLPWPGVSHDQRFALCVMIVGVALQLLFGLVDAVFRSTGRYATGTSIGTMIQIGAWGGTMVALDADGSYTGVALGGVVVQAAGLLVAAVMAMSGGHSLRWGTSGASSERIRSMVKPALSFMAFPLANALSFQGMTLLVGSALGPASVVVFNTGRTLSRIAVQITGLFSHAAWPEFARMYGEGGRAAIAVLYRQTARGAGVLAFVVSAVGLAASPWLLRMWSNDRIDFHGDLMLVMASYAALAGAWHVPRVLLMATNQHAALALWTLGSALFGLALGCAWIPMMGVVGAAAAMLAAEAAIAVKCALLARRFVAPAPFHNAEARQ